MKLPLAILFFVFQFTFSFSQSHNSDTALLVVGNFSLKNNLIREIKVGLFLEGKKVDSLVVDGNQEFGFYLARNLIYTIEMKKEGFIRRTVGISTELPDGVRYKPFFNFMFVMPLVREPEDPEENKYVKYVYDMPAGFIFYSFETKKFEHGKEYSDAVKEKLRKAKEEAAKAKKG